jgi:hypothetical protein
MGVNPLTIPILGGLGFLPCVVAVAAFVMHVAFAIGVGHDTRRYATRHGTTVLVDPWVWTLATLMGGVLVVVTYWLLHHSTLRPALEEPPIDGESGGGTLRMPGESQGDGPTTIKF